MLQPRAHLGCEVGSHGTELTCIAGLSMLCRGQPDSREGCIMLQSGLTFSLVAEFLQRSVIACSTRTSCCKGGTLWTKPQTGVCELMSWPKTHQSYVSLADILHKASISMVGGYMENPETPQYCRKWGWALARVWAFAQDNTVCLLGFTIEMLQVYI